MEDLKLLVDTPEDIVHALNDADIQQVKKAIYAPCDVKPFPNDDIFKSANIMIIGNTIVGEVLKDGFVLREDNSLKEELFSMNEIEHLKSNMKILCLHMMEW